MVDRLCAYAAIVLENRFNLRQGFVASRQCQNSLHKLTFGGITFLWPKEHDRVSVTSLWSRQYYLGRPEGLTNSDDNFEGGGGEKLGRYLVSPFSLIMRLQSISIEIKTLVVCGAMNNLPVNTHFWLVHVSLSVLVSFCCSSFQLQVVVKLVE